MADDGFEYKDMGLKNILKAIKGNIPYARIGVLGGKVNRNQQGGKNNAEVGAAHEYGTEHLPVRSFLRVPLSENLKKYLEKTGAFDKETLQKIVLNGTFRPWVEKMAAIAEVVVADAFDTGGFGKWPELKPETLERKKTKQILVETQQLRNSITSEVKD